MRSNSRSKSPKVVGPFHNLDRTLRHCHVALPRLFPILFLEQFFLNILGEQFINNSKNNSEPGALKQAGIRITNTFGRRRVVSHCGKPWGQNERRRVIIPKDEAGAVSLTVAFLQLLNLSDNIRDFTGVVLTGVPVVGQLANNLVVGFNLALEQHFPHRQNHLLNRLRRCLRG